MKKEWDALGTHFAITIWDEIGPEKFRHIADACIARTTEFDKLYSRFRTDSLITQLAGERGEKEVPADLVAMLRLYEKLFRVTGGKINPAIGNALQDTGYDIEYSLKEKDIIRPIPPLPDVLTITDNTHILLGDDVLLDLGALGKGYLVDQLYDLLRGAGVERFLVDGSGDIRFSRGGDGEITCGLEHPYDTSLAIGTFRLMDGALCASATNRRRWGDRHHYIDPDSKTSPEMISATWVRANTAALADGLSSALFFFDPESLAEFSFDYLIVNKELKIKISDGFLASSDIFS